MSRTKESLTFWDALELLADCRQPRAVHDLATERVEAALQDERNDADTLRDIGLDLLHVLTEERRAR